MKAVGLPIFAACLFVSQAAQSQYFPPESTQPPTATEVLVVCEGQYSNGCPNNIPMTGCGTVDQWAQNACALRRARYLDRKLAELRHGDACHYVVWQIVCGR
jgi:hypothetical protein